MATYCPEDGGDRELFSCPICFEDYDLQDSRRAPKLLLCLHTFCFECTQKLWKNDGSLECSMCRMLHERVCLEELFDNHVIIQHLKQEREEQDLEFARKIDREFRNEYGGSPVIVPENDTISEEHNDTVDDFSRTIDLDSTDEIIDIDEADLEAPEENNAQVLNMEEDQEHVDERSDCQNNLFADLLDSLRVSPSPSSDAEEENGDEDGNDVEGDIGVVQVHEDEEEDPEDSSDDSNGDDSGNSIFCYNNIQDLLGQDEDVAEESEGEEEVEEEEVGETTEEMNENPTIIMENLHYLFELDNDDDDEDDERFHSACDDINTTFWGGDGDLPMHEGSQDDADANTYCWQIVNQETIMDD